MLRQSLKEQLRAANKQRDEVRTMLTRLAERMDADAIALREAVALAEQARPRPSGLSACLVRGGHRALKQRWGRRDAAAACRAHISPCSPRRSIAPSCPPGPDFRAPGSQAAQRSRYAPRRSLIRLTSCSAEQVCTEEEAEAAADALVDGWRAGSSAKLAAAAARDPAPLLTADALDKRRKAVAEMIQRAERAAGGNLEMTRARRPWAMGLPFLALPARGAGSEPADVPSW